MEVELLRWLVFGVMGMAIWFLKRTLDEYDTSLRQLQKETAEIKREYLHRDDFREFKTELWNMFNEIKHDIKEIKNEKNNVAR
jgi:hypothetical protein